MSDYIAMFPEGAHVPIKMWTKGVPVEADAISQLINVASMPFIHKHVSVMPDVHVGVGATIGTVIATKGAVIPAAVGVDIGCGMEALKTNLKATDLPDNLDALRTLIELAVPNGRTKNGGANDKGAWSVDTLPYVVYNAWTLLEERYKNIIAKHPSASAYNTASHLGTLGTGNHFIEICLDQNDDVWIMLHSGSRGAGNKIGQYFIEKAKEEMRRYFIDKYLPDQNMAYLVEHTKLYDDYIEAVSWAQDFAAINRKLMLKSTVEVLYKWLKRPMNTDYAKSVISCHHNYVEMEHHYGANVLVTRKGAVRARTGDLAIIPGSMGTGSFIVQGKGNKESFCSCSHGAGRKMSRTAAHSTITLEEHAAAMQGISARLDADVLDESPAAYKSINDVMEAQSSLVGVVYSLRQIVNVKG